jgi:hypothetical protein
MIETYKPYDGEALGANKVVGEGKIGDIPEPPKTHHKNAYTPKPNPSMPPTCKIKTESESEQTTHHWG